MFKVSSKQEIRSREPGSDFVPSISTRRLSRGTVSPEDLRIRQRRSRRVNIIITPLSLFWLVCWHADLCLQALGSVLQGGVQSAVHLPKR
jgi:hypothetical protein